MFLLPPRFRRHWKEKHRRTQLIVSGKSLINSEKEEAINWNSVKHREGKSLTNKKEIIAKWKHFDEPLNSDDRNRQR